MKVNNETPQDKKLLSVGEVAAQYGISKSTLYYLRRTIPHVRFNRRIYFRPVDIESWLDSKTEGGSR